MADQQPKDEFGKLETFATVEAICKSPQCISWNSHIQALLSYEMQLQCPLPSQNL